MVSSQRRNYCKMYMYEKALGNKSENNILFYCGGDGTISNIFIIFIGV